MATSSLARPTALHFDPDWFTDPAPPWVFQSLSDAVIRQLAVVQLQGVIQIHQARIDAAKKAMDIIAKGK